MDCFMVSMLIFLDNNDKRRMRPISINDNVTDVIGKVTKSCPISLILTRKEHAQKGNPAVHRL